MDLDFSGAAVLVTGASTGIGAAIARGFGAAGAEVACHYHRDEQGASEVVDAIERDGGRALVLSGDLADPSVPARLVAEAVAELDGLDVLVNNAGALLQRSSIEEASDRLYEQTMDLNLRAVFLASRAAIPHLRARRGSIINLSSIAARTGGGGNSVLYSTAKAAVATFTRGLGRELAPSGVRVNAVSPGLIETRFHERFTPAAQYEEILATIPAGRPGEPQDCVGPTLFLAHPQAASYVTGQVLEVNGGQYTP